MSPTSSIKKYRENESRKMLLYKSLPSLTPSSAPTEKQIGTVFLRVNSVETSFKEKEMFPTLKNGLDT